MERSCVDNNYLCRLIDKFGWKGAMLITAGLVLNCIIFGALFRPLEAPKKRKKIQVRPLRSLKIYFLVLEVRTALE
jgi:hypothetical protein